MDAPQLKTVSELAKAHGQIQPVPVAGDLPFSADHLVAAATHGWAHHAFYRNAEVCLSDEDYLLAIEAARIGAIYEPANVREPQ